MDEKLRQSVALFRYSLIAPLITETFTQETQKEYLEEISAKEYNTPQGIGNMLLKLLRTGSGFTEGMELMVFIQR